MKWFAGTVSTAIMISKKNKALLVVFIESEDEKGRKMNELWDQIESSLFDCPIVGLHLRAGDDASIQFSQIYPTPVLPASYIIDKDGNPIDIITLLSDLDYDQFFAKVRDAVQKFTSVTSTSNGHSIAAGVSALSSSTGPTPQIASATSSMQDKVERAKELLKKKKAAEEDRKREEEKAKELERIQAGKLMLDMQQQRRDKELIEAAAERRKDKIAAQVDKERVKAQIKADREEREARLRRGQPMTEPSASKSSDAPIPIKPIPSDKCLIQIRFPDGSNLVNEFFAEDHLNAAIQLIHGDGRVNGNFSLSQLYPRRVFKEEDFCKSFLELCLTPNCVLLVIQERANHSKIVSSSPLNGIYSLFSLLIFAPLQYIWNAFSTAVGLNKSSSPPKKSQDPPATGGTATSDNRRSQQDNRGMSGSASIRRRGNMAGLHNPNGDDSSPEDNPNWNGNSTQFL